MTHEKVKVWRKRKKRLIKLRRKKKRGFKKQEHKKFGLLWWKVESSFHWQGHPHLVSISTAIYKNKNETWVNKLNANTKTPSWGGGGLLLSMLVNWLMEWLEAECKNKKYAGEWLCSLNHAAWLTPSYPTYSPLFLSLSLFLLTQQQCPEVSM